MRKILSLILGLLWALPALAALPDGYTQLEYIESTGTQYIDTGVKDTSKVEMNMNVTAINNDYTLLYGSQKTSTIVRRVVSLGNESHAFSVNVGSNSSASTINTGSAITLNTFHNLTFILGTTAQIIEDGVTYTASNSGDNASTGLNDYLFCYNYAGSPNYKIKAKISYAKIYGANGTLVRDFIPAKNASGVVGMYDTVGNRFYTNAGTGEFIAGDPVTDNSCRNLFDANVVLGGTMSSNDGADGVPNPARARLEYLYLSAGTYTISNNGNTINQVIGGSYSDDAGSNFSPIDVWNWHDLPFTFTLTSNRYVRFMVRNSSNVDLTNDNIGKFQFEQGDTATAYVPYCEKIKIATTKYNETAFSPLNTALANAISVVDTVVSNTITQAGRIATLQAQKQTRPNDIADDSEKCPAGKKCLLVEDASGVPHWYEIVTSLLPDGYTELEYIESTGTQYIDTGVTLTNDVSYVANIGTTKDNIVGTTGIIWQTGFKFQIRYYSNGEFNITAGFGTYEVNTLYNVGFNVDKARFCKNDLCVTKTRNIVNNSTRIKTGVYDKVASLKIYDNETLVRDFVPVKNASGVVGMFDKVNGVFYENAGEGSFIAGDPVVE